MAAKPIDPVIAETIVAQWRTGRFSQQNLADKHSVSKGVVNKLCKGVDQDTAAIVTAGIQYQHGLAQHDDRNVTAVTEVVNEAARRMEWLNETALQTVKHSKKNTEEAMLAPCGNQNEFRARADTIAKTSDAVLKAKETIFGKQPDTIINNTNAQQTNATLSVRADKLDNLSLEELGVIEELLAKAG